MSLLEQVGLVPERLFRQAMARFATGVALVTTGVVTANGPEVVGMIANSVTSVSLEPPLVLVCVHQARPLHRAVLDSRRFVINVLSAQQEALCRYFAHQSDEPVQPVWETDPSGQPALTGAIAQLSCRLHEVYPGGTHSIFLGLVETAATFAGQPLIYYRSHYGTLPWAEDLR